jgi:hypothetical protein
LTKVQRSFAIEYKSGRRKLGGKSNSIWGDMDLKSISRAIDEEATPLSSEQPQKDQSDSDASVPEAKQAEDLVALPPGHEASPQIAQDVDRTEELGQATDAVAPAPVEMSSGPKKQRKPRRAKKLAPEAAPVDVAAETIAVSSHAGGRRRHARKAKSVDFSDRAKRMTMKRVPRAAKTTKAVPPRGIDEREELLQLDQENQKLRKLLAEKLRAENAELRKRLKLN